VQIRGIPLHIWNEEFFKKVGSFFGVFLDFDEETICRKMFEVASLLISTNKVGRIDECLNVNVMGAGFPIWVVEGIPVCEDEDRSMGDESDRSKVREDVWAEEDEQDRARVS